MQSPPQVSAYARQFLFFLGRDKFEFRCFPDSPDRAGSALPQRLVGTFEAHKHDLRRLNDADYGVFVQVNESDGKGNKACNIVSAPAFFVDLDGAPLDNIKRLPLEPHFVTHTSPGKFHAYWRVKDIPLDEFKRVQQRLAALMESDKSVCDAPRVMRLPGFLHQKKPDEPFLVSPGSVADHEPFSFEEFLSALAKAEEGRGGKPAEQPTPGPARVNGPLSQELTRARSAIEHLIADGGLNPGEYHDWFRLAAALKHSYQEEGWTTFHEISAGADGYKDEADCRRQWDAISTPSDGNPLTIATIIAEAKQAGWVPPEKDWAASRPAGGSGGGKIGRFGRGHDPARAAIELAEEAGDVFWLDQHGKPHVTYRLTTPEGATVERHASIGGATYGGVLRRRYYQGAGTKTLHKDAVANATALLEYQAEESGLRFTSSLRIGAHDGRIYVDLGRSDGSVVEVRSDGWSIVAGTAVRFIRGSRGELPLPTRDGKFADFQRHFNLAATDLLRAVAFMVGTFNPFGSYPILFVCGEQGTTKSTLADMVVALTDPPHGFKSARFSFTRDEKDLHVAAKGARVLCFDNVSSVSASDGDALCRMSTGAASSSRKLYTDDEETRIVVHRPVIATSIGVPSSRADLLSRSIVVRTLPVATRRTEIAVMSDFEAKRPQLFGFLLDCVSAALRNRAAVERAVNDGKIALPRMGDFGQFVEGACKLLGLQPGEFSAIIEGEQNDLQVDAAQTHTVGSALIEYFSRPGSAQILGPAREVLDLLRPCSPEGRVWPAANKLRTELTRIAPGLRKLGIEFEAGQPGGRDHVISFRVWTTSTFNPAGQSRGTRPPDAF